jgi:hypothetical protein
VKGPAVFVVFPSPPPPGLSLWEKEKKVNVSFFSVFCEELIKKSRPRGREKKLTHSFFHSSDQKADQLFTKRL